MSLQNNYYKYSNKAEKYISDSTLLSGTCRQRLKFAITTTSPVDY